MEKHTQYPKKDLCFQHNFEMTPSTVSHPWSTTSPKTKTYMLLEHHPNDPVYPDISSIPYGKKHEQKWRGKYPEIWENTWKKWEENTHHPPIISNPWQAWHTGCARGYVAGPRSASDPGAAAAAASCRSSSVQRAEPGDGRKWWENHGKIHGIMGKCWEKSMENGGLTVLPSAGEMQDQFHPQVVGKIWWEHRWIMDIHGHKRSNIGQNHCKIITCPF